MCAYRADVSWPVAGFPGLSCLEKVPPGLDILVKATIVSALFTFVLSLINLGTFLHKQSCCPGVSNNHCANICTRRIVHRLQRLQLPGHSLYLVLIQHHNQLPYLAPLLQRAIASQTLVFWPALGLNTQNFCPLLYNTNAFLLHVAALLPSHYRVYVSLGCDIEADIQY